MTTQPYPPSGTPESAIRDASMMLSGSAGEKLLSRLLLDVRAAGSGNAFLESRGGAWSSISAVRVVAVADISNAARVKLLEDRQERRKKEETTQVDGIPVSEFTAAGQRERQHVHCSWQLPEDRRMHAKWRHGVFATLLPMQVALKSPAISSRMQDLRVHCIHAYSTCGNGVYMMYRQYTNKSRMT